MARQPDIQYVKYYTAGSAARKIEFKQPVKKNVSLPQPKVRREQKTVIHLDPISLCALVVAAVMLMAMAIGMIQLGSVNAEADKLEGYVADLQSENVRLHKEYESGYDLEAVRQEALAMGMVPMDQVEQITIDVRIAQPEPEPTVWEEFGTFLAGLFA